MRDNINNIIPSDFYDNFLSAYQKNISTILCKLSKSRDTIKRLKYLNRDLQEDNNYLRQEIKRLEDDEDSVRNLLSKKTKALLNYECNHNDLIYSINYRIKYLNFDGDELYSDWVF